MTICKEICYFIRFLMNWTANPLQILQQRSYSVLAGLGLLLVVQRCAEAAALRG